MRVGLVTTSYPRFEGDIAGNFVEQHVGYLTAAGYDVEVIAHGTSRQRLLGRHGERIYRVPAGPGLFDTGGAPEALAAGARAWWPAARFSLSLAREISARKRGWQALIAHWLVPCAVAAAWRAADLPTLAIAHAGDVHTLARLRAVPAMASIVLQRRRAPMRLSFVSAQLADHFFGRVPRAWRDDLARQSQVCPMGVDVATLRAAHRPSDQLTVSFVGRLVDIKGVDSLIAATRLWRSNARLVIAGSGPREEAWRQLAKGDDRVSFVGPLASSARDELLGRSHIVVLPSRLVPGARQEGMPVVALEAMAAGAAVIATQSGGLAELPGDAVTHLTCTTPTAIARAVDDLLADVPRRLGQIERARSFVADCDWSKIGPRLLPPPPANRTVHPRR